MRIIGGDFKGRKLKTPHGLQVRPTSDRLRETLFNIIVNRVENAGFLDICAGSGAVGIEALSRGADKVTFIERSPHAVAVIQANLDSIRAATGQRSIRVLKGNATNELVRLAKMGEHFDLVFFDPPYESPIYEQVLTQLGRGIAISEKSIVIVEHRINRPPGKAYGRLEMYREVKQGDSAISLFAIG